MKTTHKLTLAQENFLNALRRYPDMTFAVENKTMVSLKKKGIIERDAFTTSPSGTRFWTYRIVE